MGIKGFKIDFMDRDDQEMVDFHYRAAEIAAKYKLMVDFHGTYKPTGLNRTYPNVINYEAVHGLEQMKWSDIHTDQVTTMSPCHSSVCWPDRWTIHKAPCTMPTNGVTTPQWIPQ